MRLAVLERKAFAIDANQNTYCWETWTELSTLSKLKSKEKRPFLVAALNWGEKALYTMLGWPRFRE